PRSKAARGGQGGLAGDGARTHQGCIQPGLPPCLLFALESRGLLGIHGDRQRPSRFQRALDVQSTEEGSEIEARAMPRLPGPASSARAQRLLEIRETDAGIVAEPPTARSTPAAADVFPFKEHDLDAGGRKGVGRRTTSQATADERNAGNDVT